MAESEKSTEVMEVSESVNSPKNDEVTEVSATNGEQENTEKAAPSKAAGKVESIKKESSGFSSVSPSYSQLQTGLQDIVKSYVATKSSTTSKSSGKPEDEKKSSDTADKTNEGNGKRKKEESDSFGGDDDRRYYADFLDRTKSDYYCKVCDSHMNSEQMWENHVQGKRHLKNIKKEPGEPPSKIKSVRAVDITPRITKVLDSIREPVVGLDYICELQRAESYLDPTYSCFLCHGTMTTSTFVDHVLGTKHRIAYLREINPEEYSLVEGMTLKKAGMTAIAEDYAREFERKRGRGKMEVKVEKPKMAPPPSKKERRYLDDDDDDDDNDDAYMFRRRARSPMESDWRRERDRWSPPSSMMSARMAMRAPYMSPPNYSTMSMNEKLSILHQVTSSLIVVSENEAREIMRIINSLTQSLLQYKIRVLPPQLQDTLARHIITGDAQALENTLGLGGSGVSNVGNVINSMAASGDLPMRSARRGLSPPVGRMGPGNMAAGNMGPSNMAAAMNASENSRSPWGPAVNNPRMATPLRSAMHTAYPTTSQWQGGMGSGNFRGSDRSSLGY